MIAEFELELMKEAYGTLFEVENRMRKYALLKFEQEYGHSWQFIITKEIKNKCTTTNTKKLHFYQLVSSIG